MKNDKPAKKKKLKVNFKDVETRKKVPDGHYHGKVIEITEEEGDKAPYLKWTFEVMDPEYKGAKLYTNTSLAPQALWNLRSLLDALGVDTPDDEYELDIKSYIDMELQLTVTNETYEGKDQPKVTDYAPLEGTAESEDDEETTEESDEEEAEEESSDDDDEEASDEEDEDEEAEEEEKPAKKGKKQKKYSEDEVKEMDLDEMKDLLKKHGLKVKGLDDMRASKQVAAVIDALEGASLLAD